MSSPTLSWKGRALRYLAQREHSRAELERKLRRHVAPDDDGSAVLQIAQALDALAAKGLLSDQRAAESVLNSKSPRFGVRRLQQELQAKGLDASLVAAAMAQARAGEPAVARDLWKRRFGVVATDAKERARQMRFLAGRGFSAEVIAQVVRGAETDE